MTGTETEPEVVDAVTVDDRPLPAVVSVLAVTPQVKASELVARIDVIREAMEKAMKRDVDYGVIPGTGSKPTLLKPGAEKLGVLFQLDVQIVNHKTFSGDHLTVSSEATVFHSPTGARLGFGEGMCSTRERKYAYRQQQRLCPECDEPTVFKSKHPPRDRPDDPPGWFCWAKKGGCGANFAADDARVITQEQGQVDNPDLPDSWNTVVKMAEKRARIDAILAVTGASALFTQDMDDAVEPAGQAPTRAARQTGPLPPSTDPSQLLALKAAAGGLTNSQIRAAFGVAEVKYRAGNPGAIFDYLEPAEGERLLSALEGVKAAADADLPWSGGKP